MGFKVGESDGFELRIILEATMNIGIVTVYNSYNCGSYLQAYALYKTLSKQGNIVAFLKREPYRLGTLRYRICKAIKALLKGHPIKALFIIKEHFNFKKIQKKLPKISTLDGVDLVIYGSDTIWNLEAAYFKANIEKYWGIGVENKKITYAASVGSTKAENFYEDPVFKKSINDFCGVAVRDEHTYTIAKNLLEGREPTRVIDPTMLLSTDDYSELIAKSSKEGFILVYYFGKMPKKQKVMLKKFAQSQNKKIITFGKSVPFFPEYMLAYYKAADYVITNTFHGNIFSIMFNKRFVSYGKEQKKVVGLLEEFGLSHRLLNDDDVIDQVLLSEINYDEVNAVLSKKREQSLEYLNQFIRESGREN